jgi:hypothetical protein
MEVPVMRRCRLLGHRWRFGVEGREVIWACERCGAAGGRRAYADAREARYHAAYFDRARPKPPGPFLAAFGGLMPRKAPPPRGERDRESER